MSLFANKKKDQRLVIVNINKIIDFGMLSRLVTKRNFTTFRKVQVANPVVDMDGDEMTRVIWKWIKERHIHPYVDVKSEYYDLSVTNRDATEDRVTTDAAKATLKHKVAIKCATITPDKARVKEFNLKQMWKSPNGTIRNILDGTVFREPICISNIPKCVPGWKKPIIIGRHAFGDQYRCQDNIVTEPGSIDISFTPKSGGPKIVQHVADIDAGVYLGMFNTHSSVETFARACFAYALNRNFPLKMSSKNTILKKYDGLFVDTFERVYREEYFA